MRTHESIYNLQDYSPAPWRVRNITLGAPSSDPPNTIQSRKVSCSKCSANKRRAKSRIGNKSTSKSDSRINFRVTPGEASLRTRARAFSSLLNNVAELYQHNLEREPTGASERARRYLADSRKIAERLAISSSPFDLSDRRSVCRRFPLSLVYSIRPSNKR